MENVDMITILITLLVMFVAIMAGIAAILKYLFKLNDRLTNLEISTNERFTSLEKNMNERFIRIESKLEMSSKDYVYTNKRVDDTILNTNNRIDKIEEYNKNVVVQIIDKLATTH